MTIAKGDLQVTLLGQTYSVMKVGRRRVPESGDLLPDPPVYLDLEIRSHTGSLAGVGDKGNPLHLQDKGLT